MSHAQAVSLQAGQLKFKKLISPRARMSEPRILSDLGENDVVDNKANP
jgi:hypothetical protein